MSVMAFTIWDIKSVKNKKIKFLVEKNEEKEYDKNRVIL